MNEKGYEFTRYDCRLILNRLDRDYDTKINYDDLKFLFKTHITEIVYDDKEVNEISNNLTFGNKSGKNSSENSNTCGNSYNNTYNNLYTDSNSIRRTNNKNYKNNNKNNYTFESYIEDLIHLITNFEQMKNILSVTNDIVIIELFYLFDNDKKTGKIDKESFTETIKKFGIQNIFNKSKEIDLIFKQYDTDNDGVLDFDEFYSIFMPLEFEFARLMRNKLVNQNISVDNYSTYGKNKNYNIKLSRNSISLLTKFFTLLIETELKIESNRAKLNSNPLFSTYEEFCKIKDPITNHVNYDSLTNFLVSTPEFNLPNRGSDYFLLLLFDRFIRQGGNYASAYSKNYSQSILPNTRLSFNDFVEEISPKYSTNSY